MSDEDLDAALENWGRFCRVTKGIRECDSLEHRYRSPQEWYEVVPRIPVVAADTELAILVNRAWLQMPYPYKAILCDWYVLRRDPRRTCGRMHLRFSAHGEYLCKARLMCRNLMISLDNSKQCA